MMKLGVQVAKGCHFHVVIREDRMMICGIVLRQHRNVTDDRRHPYIDRRLAKMVIKEKGGTWLVQTKFNMTTGWSC